MVVPFGFSIGDFIAITQLIGDIWACAAATPGLKSEIDRLASQYTELLALMRTLCSLYPHNPTAISVASRNCMDHHLVRCRTHLEDFRREVRVILADAAGRSSASRARDLGRRLMFTPNRGAVFARLNSHFQRDLDAFRLCVDAVAGYTTMTGDTLIEADLSREQHVANTDRLEQILRGSKATARSFDALICMLGSMPKDLGYTWEAGELKQHVSLVQASGETMTVPIQICESFDEFHRFLLVQDGYPGRQRILQHQYRLMDCSTGATFDAGDMSGEPAAWERLVRPGLKLRLSVAVGFWIEWKTTGVYCPRCSSERIADAMIATWKQCRDCKLEWEQKAIQDWRHSREPIDAPWQWDLPGQIHEDAGRDASADSPVESSVIQTESQSVETPPSESEQGNRIVEPEKDIFTDREDRLQRITVLHTPIWNLVFRAFICGCRLAGDSSPFAPDVDIRWEVPCRLHFFDCAAARLGMQLSQPAEGYDPAEDPYFDRFGGHAAFAAFIAGHPVVQRAIDVRKLFTGGSEIAATEALRNAMQVEEQKCALFKWQEEFHQWYLQWKSKYGKEHDEKMKELRDKEDTSSRKRRDSF